MIGTRADFFRAPCECALLKRYFTIPTFASPERLLLSDEIKKVIFDTLESLPEELKMAISLRELDGMSYEDIANVMDCPVGTVRSRIFRAREAIDKKLQPLLEQ